MRAIRLSILIAFSVVAVEGTSLAQNAPPPADPNAPPPGYQQPPPGYQQQPPPGYQQPPPGYAQQPPPGYQQQPPPGYYQQPGYPPPTAYGYQQPPGYAAEPPAKHGFLALPYLGFESHRGNTGQGLSAGFIMGALLGGRISPNFSLNGELRLDVLNPDTAGSGVDVTIIELDLAVSPLFHVPFRGGEFVVGPKLGLFVGADSLSYGGIEQQSDTATGYVAGVNSGVFFDVSRRVALGGLVSFSVRDASRVCTTISGGSENCRDVSATAEKVLAFHFGALF
jgi:hypothetical protein